MGAEHPQPPGAITRRRLIIGAAGAVMAGGAGYYLGRASQEQPTHVPEPVPPVVDVFIESSEERVANQFEKPVLNPMPQENLVRYDTGDSVEYGIGVTINRDGLPVTYRLPDGREFPFDAKQVYTALQKTKASQEPELINVIELLKRPLPNRESDWWGTREHPVLRELPQDTLTEAELASRGISIIQADNTKLHIRIGAFEQQNLLSSFSRIGQNLTIGVIDGPVVENSFMRGSRYDRLRSLVPPPPIRPTEARNKKIEEYEKDLKYLSEYAKQQIRENDSSYVTSWNYLIKAKEYLYAYNNFLPDTHVLIDYFSANTTGFNEARGYYIDESSLVSNPLVRKGNYAFITAGRSKLDTDLVSFYFLPDGSFKIGYAYGVGRTSGVFQDSNIKKHYNVIFGGSCPDPDTFGLNPGASPDKPNSYPYGGQTPGLVLRHELAHGKLITGQVNPNYSEYDTDMLAMQGIRDAWESWKQSDYTDHNGYHYLFEEQNSRYYLA